MFLKQLLILSLPFITFVYVHVDHIGMKAYIYLTTSLQPKIYKSIKSNDTAS